MTVYEMLTEVICSKEFSGLVASIEVMNVGHMLQPGVPIIREIRKLFATVTTGIGSLRGKRIESTLIARHGPTGPGVRAQMKRVLMPLSFIFVLESSATECTLVLFLQHMFPEINRWVNKQNAR